MGVFLGNMTIALNESDSNSIGGRLLRSVKSIEIHAPAALDGTVTLAAADQLGETSFTTVQSGGADVGLTSSKVLVITDLPFHALRVESDGSEDPAKVFPVFGEERAHQ